MSGANSEQNYKTTANLTKRGDFNARYGTFSWFGWVAERVPPPSGDVLDIGCGPGWFWKRMVGRWTPTTLTLADTSCAMLEAAQGRLATDFQVTTVMADVIHLPFEDNSFDHVFAMHMLYHSSDPAKGLAEIARVLKPGGHAVITTVADDDLAPMADLSREIFGSSGTDLLLPVFSGTRAAALLPNAFAKVIHQPSRDIYAVDDSNAALAYITSFPPGISADRNARQAFHDRFDALRVAAGGAVKMNRLQDLFLASQPRS